MQISSASNPRIKLVRHLLTRTKARRVERQFVIEGLRIVQDALAANLPPAFVLYRDDLEPTDPILTLVDELEAAAVDCFSVDAPLFNELADTETPQGILGVCSWPELMPPDPLDFVLVLDGLKNPGNVGSALRTAVAVGVSAAILTPGTVDPFNPKVVRGAMGAHFRLPILHWDWEQLAQANFAIYVADLGGTQAIYEIDFTQPVAIVVGGEARGPQRQALQLATAVVRIPMEDGESLNATVAASVILYEAYRQRHFR